jgi:hypothetical protein
MSKAGEWTALNQQMRLQISRADEAMVTSAGDILVRHYSLDGIITEQITYTPEEALALARWISIVTEAGPPPPPPPSRDTTTSLRIW